jgi:hypothetical protein
MLLSLPGPVRDHLAGLCPARLTPRLVLRLALWLVMAAAVAGFVWVLWTESIYRR